MESNFDKSNFIYDNVLMLCIVSEDFDIVKPLGKNLELLVKFKDNCIMPTVIIRTTKLLNLKRDIEFLKQKIHTSSKYIKLDSLVLYYNGHGSTSIDLFQPMMSFILSDKYYSYGGHDKYNIFEFINFQLITLFHKIKSICIIYDSCRSLNTIEENKSHIKNIVYKNIPICIVFNTKSGEVVYANESYGTSLTQEFFGYIMTHHIMNKVVSEKLYLNHILMMLNDLINKNFIKTRKLVKDELKIKQLTIVVESNEIGTKMNEPGANIASFYINDINQRIMKSIKTDLLDSNNDKIVLGEIPSLYVETHIMIYNDLLNVNALDTYDSVFDYVQESNHRFVSMEELINEFYKTLVFYAKKDQNDWAYMDVLSTTSEDDDNSVLSNYLYMKKIVFHEIVKDKIMYDRYIKIRNINLLITVIHMYTIMLQEIEVLLFTENRTILISEYLPTDDTDNDIKSIAYYAKYVYLKTCGVPDDFIKEERESDKSPTSPLNRYREKTKSNDKELMLFSDNKIAKIKDTNNSVIMKLSKQYDISDKKYDVDDYFLDYEDIQEFTYNRLRNILIEYYDDQLPIEEQSYKIFSRCTELSIYLNNVLDVYNRMLLGLKSDFV
jgi:hypothetical protein